jgi:hypothetical protein
VYTVAGALATTDYYGDDLTYRKGESKIFCQMDFTSGYHRALMSAAARIFTAFICWCGLFEWLRVPMGLEGAPSYFQKVMATIVLAGLIWIHGVELYFDDL